MTAPTLEKMREAAPHYGMGPHPWKDEDRDVLRWRARYRLWLKRHVTQRRTKGIGPTGGCSYCIRAATQRRLIVSPIEHWRRYEGLCNRRRCERRLLAWEQMGAARERRAVRDWELQHPDQVEYELTQGCQLSTRRSAGRRSGRSLTLARTPPLWTAARSPRSAAPSDGSALTARSTPSSGPAR